jgi:RNA polymerase sigma-54 factor
MVTLNQRLQQKLLQKLSPQQIQMIKLLEVPSMLLEQRIKKELEENPALEEGPDEETADVADDVQDDDLYEDKDQEEFTLDDYIDDDDIPDYRLQSNNYSKDEKRSEIPFSAGSSFHEHLQSQLGLRSLTDRQKVLGEYIIGNIDEDGYLRREISSISDDLAFLQNLEVTEDELEEILEVIQDFDPAGVGARTLQECLLLQISRREDSNGNVAVAKAILASYFEEFTKRHYDKISQRLELTDDELKAAIDEILKLNPKPGGSVADPYSRTAQQIIPDFILEQTDNGLDLHLNSRNLPDLKVSRTYSEMLEAYSRDRNSNKELKEAVSFVRQKLDAAKWFIDAIRQRQNTLLLTMNAIIQYQKEYFTDGDETKMKPMILKDIAEMTGLDISTVSRVANSKYIQTHFGIYSLKFFFSEGLQTDSGEEVSTREIKKILEECLAVEDKRKPLTDEKLTDILQEKGYQIARRTVAKYREQLNIPVARLRKEIG